MASSNKIVAPLLVAMVLVMAMVSLGYAATVVEPNASIPGILGSCYYRKDNKLIKFGESYTPTDECKSLLCSSDYTLQHLLCSFPQGCSYTRPNNTLTYPDCCPQVIDCKEAGVS